MNRKTPKKTKNLVRLQVLLFSFVSVHLLNVVDLAYYYHYIGLSVSSLFVVYFCSKTFDKVLLLYAVLQVVLISIYTGLQTDSYGWFLWVLYDPPLNFSMLLLSYELFIVLMVGLQNVQFVLGRANDAKFGGLFNRHSAEKVV